MTEKCETKYICCICERTFSKENVVEDIKQLQVTLKNGHKALVKVTTTFLCLECFDKLMFGDEVD